MDRGDSRKRSVRLVGTLACAVGLSATGAVALWQGRKASELEAQRQARRSTELMADALRGGLVEREFLAGQPNEWRFELDDGSLVVPTEIAWFDPDFEPGLDLMSTAAGRGPPDVDPAAALSDPALIALAQAEATATAEAGRSALDAASTDPLAARHWVSLVVGWAAEHRQDVPLRDECLAALDVDLPDPSRAAITSAVLLAARADRPPPAWALRFLPRLSALEAAALAARIRENGTVEVAATVAAASERATRLRATLASAQRHLDSLVQADAPLLLDTHAGELLAYAPAIAPDGSFAPGRGRGVVWPPAERLAAGTAAAIRGRLWEPGSGRATAAVALRGAASGASALPLTRELVLVGAPPPDPGMLGGGRGLLALLAGFMALFVAGLVLALRALQREAAATAARADFLTSVTHELKTPLASIRLFAELLLDGRVTDAAKRDDYHRLLAGESERLSALIENVLDLGRIDRGERALDVRLAPLATTVREVVERFAPLAQRDGLQVELQSESDASVPHDRGAVAQTLVNLLENARKYAAAGGRIEIVLAVAATGAAQIVVRDFGPGVPEPERERIFERFRRGERQRDGSIAGVGLGLHLARTLMRAQGGDVACRAPAEGGAGAEFVVSFAAVATAAASAPATTIRPAVPSSVSAP